MAGVPYALIAPLTRPQTVRGIIEVIVRGAHSTYLRRLFTSLPFTLYEGGYIKREIYNYINIGGREKKGGSRKLRKKVRYRGNSI